MHLDQVPAWLVVNLDRPRASSPRPPPTRLYHTAPQNPPPLFFSHRFGVGLQAMPLEDERVRMLREAGAVLVKHFEGQVAELVRRCGGSARDLVAMVTMYFPGFRDASVYGGRQVFFYKRAQIFVGDLWGSFGGAGLGAFDDIER